MGSTVPQPASLDSRSLVHDALGRQGARRVDGLLDRLFAFAFKGLVYPQIWEDPKVDMEALNLQPGARIMTIASGGCNAMSYLTADPGAITAVDLNRAHVALTRLKLIAAQRLEDYDSYYRFFGEARGKENVATYEEQLKDHLDAESRAYWEGRDWRGRRRITLFARGLYRQGLLGNFIGLSHLVAKLYGIDPNHLMQARSMDEQRAFFDTALLPLFDKRLVKWATSQKVSLYGLGIPPAQYESLASAGGGDMALVLKRRLEKLACDFSLEDNYFAWQAFGRSYAAGGSGPLPPYLERRHFDAIQARASRVNVLNRSFTDHLQEQTEDAFDAYLLLDAQDWMSDAQLNALWSEITRTATPGARVVFRTAAEPSLLPGRVTDDILDRWHYDEEESKRFTDMDRSSIYGGVHLYTLKD
jgi:S-adenosylmethionine-diacylglycerol 3-amino-3-carboxypropyl transferase